MCCCSMARCGRCADGQDPPCTSSTPRPHGSREQSDGKEPDGVNLLQDVRAMLLHNTPSTIPHQVMADRAFRPAPFNGRQNPGTPARMAKVSLLGCLA